MSAPENKTLEKTPCLSPTQVVMRSLPLANASLLCFLVMGFVDQKESNMETHQPYPLISLWIRTKHRALGSSPSSNSILKYPANSQRWKTKKTFLHDPNLSSRGHYRFNKRSMCLFHVDRPKMHFCLVFYWIKSRIQQSLFFFFFCSAVN